MFLRRVTEMSAKTLLEKKDPNIICVGKDLGGEYVLMRVTEKLVCRETITLICKIYSQKLKGTNVLFFESYFTGSSNYQEYIKRGMLTVVILKHEKQ